MNEHRLFSMLEKIGDKADIALGDINKLFVMFYEMQVQIETLHSILKRNGIVFKENEEKILRGEVDEREDDNDSSSDYVQSDNEEDDE